METLGPPAFNFCGKRFTRTDFTLRTKRGYNLECSHWEPVERSTDRIPVVIYMHGNSSARVEVIPQLSYLLSLGVAVFAFDFAGSGKSDGDYVSLGYYEREDLSCVVAHLRATAFVSTIALWGRSVSFLIRFGLFCFATRLIVVSLPFFTDGSLDRLDVRRS
jgi:pimeloyl-ACP methyl ester carboxylesterase